MKVKKILLFLVGFAAITFALNHWLPVVLDDDVQDKLAKFTAQKDEITTLFLGTSQFWREIEPARFDRVMKSHGIEVSSYNLSFDRLSAYEAEVILQEVLKLKPAKLKTIFLDARSTLGWDDDPEVSGLERDVYWRNPIRGFADLSVQWISFRNQPSWETVVPVFRALAGNFEKMINHGRLWTWAAQRFQSVSPQRDPARGFSALDGNNSPNIVAMRKAMLDHWDEFRKRVEFSANHLSPPWNIRQDPDGSRFNRLIDLAKNRGLTVGIIACPNPYHPAFPVKRCQGPGSPCLWLDFSQGPNAPELFRTDYYYDSSHLNKKGSELFTVKLAESVYRALQNWK